MNVAQALAVAAAALVVAGGPERTNFFIASANAQAVALMDRAAIRGAAVELADLMERNYVFPDAAREYAQHLRTRAASGAYDGLSDPEQLAARLQSELRAVHDDAHLRVTVNDGAAQGGAGPHRRALSGPAIGNDLWLADGVAYFRINGLPGNEDSIAAMTRIVDQYANARTLIIDARACPGGGLDEMDVLFSRIFRERTHLVTMDTRTGASDELTAAFDGLPSLHRAPAPATITRWEHWTEPAARPSPLRDARIFLLTDFTASACEHLALALKESGRATLVGATTRGAGHYGGERAFGNGRFSVFLPVGRTYAPRTGQGWEGVGIAPDRAVAPEDALSDVLREIGVPLSAAANVTPLEGPVVRRVVEGAPGRRIYGIGVVQPRGGEPYVRIEEVAPGMVAEQAGLRRGDRIVSVNGVAVADIAPGGWPQAMRASPLTVVVERGDERLSFTMSLE